MHPCPTLEDFAKNISNQFNYSGRFLSLPKIIIKFLLFLSFVYTKVIKKNNALNYHRLIKLFRANTIVPNYLIVLGLPKVTYLLILLHKLLQ